MSCGKRKTKSDAGFSLLELLIAMTVTIVLMGCASTLLSASFRVRTREHARTDSIADVQRAINTMSREISIGGYGFGESSNGLVSGDCDQTSIRVRSNLNRYSGDSLNIESSGEDLKFLVDNTNGQSYLVRYDRFPPAGSAQATVLANRIDDLAITYWGPGNTPLNVAADPTQVANAVGVRITVTANLAAVGTPGSPGYQPESTVQLSSDVALRNKSENLATY
jgi:prepilin-type N-terminal cleavage/methylation domain-containing protein